jgi:hypothetical protein
VKTINATLLAAQTTAAGSAIATANLYDNDRLHVGVGAAFASAAFAFGVNTGTSFIRVRGSGGDLEYQRITDPGVASQWTTWTGFGATNVGGLGVFYTGTYLVAFWQETTTFHIKYRRSSDDGQNWSATATAYTTFTAAIQFWGVSGAASNSGIMGANNTGTPTLHWGLYNPGADTWTTIDSNTPAAFSVFVSGGQNVAAAWDSANSRWLIVVSATRTDNLNATSIHILTRSAAGAWSTPRVFYRGTPDSDYRDVSISQSQINGFWWISATLEKDWVVGANINQWIAASDDGEHYQDVYSIGTFTNQHTLLFLGAHPASASNITWLSNADYRYQATAHSDVTGIQVVSYQLDAPGRLSCVLNNGTGLVTNLAVMDGIEIVRGLNIAGTDYTVSAGLFYVTSIVFRLAGALGQLVEVEARDASELLKLWRADQIHAWSGETLQTQIRLVAALAGVHSVTFDAAAVWSDTIPSLTALAKTTGEALIHSLLLRASADYRVTETGGLYCYVPTTGGSSQHTYGAANHRYWLSEFGSRRSPNFHFAIIASVDGGAETANPTRQSAYGWRFTEVLDERRISNITDGLELTNARKVVADEAAISADVDALPNFALEVGDVVNFADLVGPAQLYRVTRLRETFNAPGARHVFYQTLTLRGAN